LIAGVPKRAFILNTTSATATLPGVIAGYFWRPAAREAIPRALALPALRERKARERRAVDCDPSALQRRLAASSEWALE